MTSVPERPIETAAAVMFSHDSGSAGASAANMNAMTPTASSVGSRPTTCSRVPNSFSASTMAAGYSAADSNSITRSASRRVHA